jgi:hypothetical protein
MKVHRVSFTNNFLDRGKEGAREPSNVDSRLSNSYLIWIICCWSHFPIVLLLVTGYRRTALCIGSVSFLSAAHRQNAVYSEDQDPWAYHCLYYYLCIISHGLTNSPPVDAHVHLMTYSRAMQGNLISVSTTAR